MNKALETLKARGFFAQCTDEQALSDRMDKGPVTFYVGCDLEGFTYNLPVKCEEAIMKNKQLGRFLRISNQRLKPRK